MEVIPSKSNRASSGVNLKTGVDERGSQKIRCPLAQAEIILFPGKFYEGGLILFERAGCLPSGVNSPQLTGPVWPANTCIVFPEGTIFYTKG